MKQKFSIAMSLSVILAMLLTSIALADNLVDDLAVVGNATINQGGSTTVGYKINANGGDGLQGCNADDGTSATVTLNVPADVTATSLDSTWNATNKSLTFSVCKEFKYVTFSSNKAGDFAITVLSISDSGAGSYSNEANFTLHVLDVTAPNTTIDSQPSNPSNSASAEFYFSGTDNAGGLGIASFECSLDGSAFATCPSPKSYSGLLDGSHKFEVRAKDAAGNVDASPASYTWMIDTTPLPPSDTTPPVVTVPANIIAEATGPDGAAVSFSASASDVVDGAITPSCTPASGSTFALDTTTVTCSATDAHGNTGSKSFSVTVRDTTAPSLTVPANIIAEATSGAGAPVSFNATASDAVDPAPVVTCDPASGSTFALGTTTVSCTAKDATGNMSAAKTFSVTVQDTTPPAITVPNHITAEATGPAGAAVTFAVSATDLVDGVVAPSCDYASGSTFVLGTTTVTCTATDAHQNTSSKSFNVNVVDTTPPAVTVPANITKEATGPSGAAASFTASATDIVDGAITATCSPASGSTFALGVTTVTCSATDAHGNQGSASFTVTVQDTTPPTLALPVNMTVPATSLSGAVVTFTATASDLVDGPVAVTCMPASGSTFAPGTTTVNCSATDAHGNTASGSFQVWVTYQPSGFFQPVDMSNGSTIVWNTVKNGSTVPLKFRLFAGSTELTSTSYVVQPLKAVGVACGTGTADDIELTSTGGTNLRYDTTGGQFIYNWQTPKIALACYKVTVSFTDGSSLSAYFKLK